MGWRNRRTMRLTKIFLAVTMAVTFAPAPAAQAAMPGRARVEAQAMELVNKARVSRRLPALRWNTHLRDVARAHSQAMAKRGKIYHSANLERKVMRFRRLGENVGVGPDMRRLHNALMDSPGHRRNILGSYKLAGFGVHVTKREIYLTQIFLTPR